MNIKGKVSNNTSNQSLWRGFWNVVLWIVVLMVVLYVVLGIVFAVYFLQTRRSLEKYIMENLKRLSQDAGETYDFTVDPRGVVPMNTQLSRDVMTSLMQYYQNNFNTVRTVVKNYVSTEDDHVALFGSTLFTNRLRQGNESRTMVTQDVPDVFSPAFQEDATKFVTHASSSLPPDVLTKTEFYSRFFSMVIATITDPAKADAIAKLWEWIHGQIG